MASQRKLDWQGMNWLRQEKRLAIYLRDGLSCVWCGSSIEDGVQLSLDHLKPHSKGGDNHETNLVTCCSTCNSSRGNRSVQQFAKVTAAYRNRGATAKQILGHIGKTTTKALDKQAALKIIAARGTVAKFLNSKQV